ncbi:MULTISPECIES: helix-turn-helix domain-containing protein [Pseudomonas]|uniref:Helix-turn-helix transcriptional regulator n=1 Tax=Pseudomonas veronii TaxID=76761 RepID=A0A4P7YA71_PSEVE|nr:helix-turn-helix transcriptional regulator [Pseudomonas veronii]
MRHATSIAIAPNKQRQNTTASGLSLTELAKRAGVAKSTLSQLESGIGNPSIETLWSLLNAGDYISYLANVPHVFEALEADTTAVMVIEHS